MVARKRRKYSDKQREAVIEDVIRCQPVLDLRLA
jgi:hypothetical protein